MVGIRMEFNQYSYRHNTGDSTAMPPRSQRRPRNGAMTMRGCGAVAVSVVTDIASHPLDGTLAEQAGGPDEQEGNCQHVGEPVAKPLRPPAAVRCRCRPGLSLAPMMRPPAIGAGDRREAADDEHRQRLEDDERQARTARPAARSPDSPATRATTPATPHDNRPDALGRSNPDGDRGERVVGDRHADEIPARVVAEEHDEHRDEDGGRRRGEEIKLADLDPGQSPIGASEIPSSRPWTSVPVRPAARAPRGRSARPRVARKSAIRRCDRRAGAARGVRWRLPRYEHHQRADAARRARTRRPCSDSVTNVSAAKSTIAPCAKLKTPEAL